MEELIAYMGLHLMSLLQDSDKLNKDMELIEDLDSDEYKDMEIMDISLNGQIIATNHLLTVAKDILER